jgi:hypothetical protein
MRPIINYQLLFMIRSTVCAPPLHRLFMMIGYVRDVYNQRDLYNLLWLRCGLDMDTFNLCDGGKLCRSCKRSPLVALDLTCCQDSYDHTSLDAARSTLGSYIQALRNAEIYLKSLTIRFERESQLPKVIVGIVQSLLYHPTREKVRERKVQRVLNDVVSQLFRRPRRPRRVLEYDDDELNSDTDD